MLRKVIPFILGSIALSLAVTWVVSMVRLQKANGSFDGFMKREELELTPDEVEPSRDEGKAIAPKTKA